MLLYLFTSRTMGCFKYKLFCSISVLIFLSLDAFNDSVPTRNRYQLSNAGCTLLLEPTSIWLFGETPVTGLTNQMAAVYSYIAVAKLLNSNLILGEMFSRKNFEISMREFFDLKDAKKSLSFADFFDIDHFRSFWMNEFDRKIVEYHEIEQCLPDASHRIVSTQRPTWRSLSDARIVEMLQFHNISMSIVSNSPTSQNKISGTENSLEEPIRAIKIPDGLIIRIKSKMKLLGFYNFRQSTNHLALLVQVHHSIRPNLNLRSATEHILSLLPKNFIVMHMRIEGDVIFHRPKKFSPTKADKAFSELLKWSSSIDAEKNIAANDIISFANKTFRKEDPLFFETLPRLLESISSQLRGCMNSAFMASDDTTTIYVASGMFRAAQGTFMWKRSKFAVMLLKTLLSQSNVTITSRFQMLEQQSGNFLERKLIFETELAAYVDLQVARNAHCFISAHCPSSFSYTVQRLKELDQGILVSMIDSPNLTYKEFFF